jgi:molybdopterin synthase sulfur carrier subunit
MERLDSMPVVWIPSLMRSLTNNQEQVEICGETLREVVESLESSFPGIKDRICEDDRIRPGLAVSVDGVVGNEGLRQRVDTNSEIHFVTAIAGGA